VVYTDFQVVLSHKCAPQNTKYERMNFDRKRDHVLKRLLQGSRNTVGLLANSAVSLKSSPQLPRLVSASRRLVNSSL
jgi:hypothetical protein